VLTTRSGPVTLVVAHAGGRGAVPDRNWHQDLRALAGANISGPRIMAGDLGATPWHAAFRNLRSQGWHEAADVLGRGLRPTWPSWGIVPFSPLEQVMVGGGAGVRSADTVAIAGTSHRALLVTVVLPGRPSTPDA
jgi:endonuclease/exonuclease/phosphatase (EEP) superfamily protein YafD